MTTQQWDQEMASAQADPVIAALAGWLRAAADRPEGFWQGQRVAIQERIQDSERRASLRLAWAWSLALIAVAFSLLTQAPPPVAAAYDPDHDLLVGVEQAVRRPVPKALEPARLLAQEIERSATAAKTDSQ
jgi:hypothetical protein